MEAPKNLLIYYGWLNSFNSGDNSWNNELVAKDMARNQIVVLGSGIESTGHGDNTNINVILPRIKELNPEIETYGYVTVNQTYANFKSKVDDWVANRSVEGIFFDEAGYDYGSVATNGRESINSKIDYVHSLGLKCFINAWKIEHIFGTNTDASYPDSTWNPNNHDINLYESDWYLLESHAVTATNTYESASLWLQRGEDAVEKCTCNIAAVGCITEGSGDQGKFNFLYTSALMFELNAVGSSDYASSVSYGASNGKAKFYDRPSLSNTGSGLNISIEQDNGDSDIYWRYLSQSRLKLDFSSGSELSEIDNF